MKKSKSKKEKKPKNPILKWLCFVCHHHKSTKTLGHVINAITLKCSMCDEFLKYHSISDNYKDGLAISTRCTNGIALPLCSSCGEPMQEFDASLDDLKANPIENDDPIPMLKKKKSWWE
tara:strand:- start:158 stop:514 length:357 start_codon:yes stop_codon:yes gene_type:complete